MKRPLSLSRISGRARAKLQIAKTEIQYNFRKYAARKPQRVEFGNYNVA